MQIIKTIPLEDCLDGSHVVEVEFDEPVTRLWIEAWEPYGDWHYYPDFARPYYSIRVPGRFHLKGVEGKKRLRLTLQGDASDSLDVFCEMSVTFSNRQG